MEEEEEKYINIKTGRTSWQQSTTCCEQRKAPFDFARFECKARVCPRATDTRRTRQEIDATHCSTGSTWEYMGSKPARCDAFQNIQLASSFEARKFV